MPPGRARIDNAQAVTSIFGAWPAFHDAEVLALRLARDAEHGPTLEADLSAFRSGPEVEPGGHYRQYDGTLVTLAFAGVRDLSLDGFNEQNVLFSLTLAETEADGPGEPRWEVAFDSSYGLSIAFTCARIAVLRADPLSAPPSS